jgi:hypothetical protein
MSLLRDINPHVESDEYLNWRLLVKQRLYNHNIVGYFLIMLIKDTLAQLSKAERIDKLQQTFKGVEDDYLRLLKLRSNGFNGDGFNGDTMEMDDDDDEEANEIDERPTKRVRIQ